MVLLANLRVGSPKLSRPTAPVFNTNSLDPLRFADVSNYHYAGRMANRGYRPSPGAVPTTAFPAAPMMASNGRLLPITPSTPSHRRPIFRSSALEDHPA